MVLILTPLEGSNRQKILTENGPTQIRVVDVDGYHYCRNYVENSALADFPPCFFSCFLFIVLREGVAGSEGKWVINSEETSQYLVHVASSSLSP